ncbi:tubulin-specific chaperone E [Lindgomyces ingoldianus]|uniref:Tubulin-specific chaperone E n=1 Tax=Lindgomyces ingoldianus TaxID=673940 RepID=A0ACB6QZ52_9PLEO|nr:tubulin-specific chaperone E [Lindgomyces ingoldianus]KAF2472274.1 tubulin-specific chaperone E [Lindgomyces ingoldianus]
MATDLYIGKRLSFDVQLCTVRYIGKLKGTKGEWLGVEWDDPTRGKHSGENGGIKYFECANKQPTAGSFVRPGRKSDPPQSFVEALKMKYASEYFEDPDVQIVFTIQDNTKPPLSQPSRPIRISGKEVEEVGFDKIRKQLADLNELRIVILDGLCMSRPIATLRERKEASQEDAWPTGLTDIKDVCPKTVELDLSRNLFEEWREVASICEQLDKLRSLRVDGNRFRDTTLTNAERQRCLKAFGNIKTLRLEDTLLSWEEITRITTLFPTLTTFVASSNLYTTLTPHLLTPTITDLTLEDNLFPSLSSLSPLTRLPNLQRLVLKSNKISSASPSDVPLPIFSHTITDVDLSYNAIVTWAFIDALAHVFPGLTSLRISHNPLYHSLQSADGRTLSVEDGYMLTLARLGALKILNYSPITAKERLNAESYYLSLISRELVFSPPELADQIIASHPRYQYLCAEYGEPVIHHEAGKVNPNSLAARLVRCTFYLGASAKASLSTAIASSLSLPTVERIEAEVPTSFTAYSLLGFVAKEFSLPPRKLRLVWETGDWMLASRALHDVAEEEWDSESESESGSSRSGGDDGVELERDGGERVMREVEIVPGTKLVGTWIDGMEAVIRVEMR